MLPQAELSRVAGGLSIGWQLPESENRHLLQRGRPKQALRTHHDCRGIDAVTSQSRSCMTLGNRNQNSLNNRQHRDCGRSAGQRFIGTVGLVAIPCGAGFQPAWTGTNASVFESTRQAGSPPHDKTRSPAAPLMLPPRQLRHANSSR